MLFTNEKKVELQMVKIYTNQFILNLSTHAVMTKNSFSYTS